MAIIYPENVFDSLPLHAKREQLKCMIDQKYKNEYIKKYNTYYFIYKSCYIKYKNEVDMGHVYTQKQLEKVNKILRYLFRKLKRYEPMVKYIISRETCGRSSLW